MVGRNSLLAWGGMLVLAALLLLGAWLSMRSIARAADTTPTPGGPAEVAAARAGDDTALMAPSDVCPGADDLAAPVADQARTELCLLNYARRVEGLGALAMSPRLMQSAALKALDIVRCSQFSHDACGLDVRQRFADSGYFAPDLDSRFGENLAWGGADAGSPRGALLGWLDSPAHRANLLRPEWTEQGIALIHVPSFRGVDDTRIWVSHFGRRG